MNLAGYIVTGCSLIILLAAAAFNRKVRLRNRVRRAWHDIDVQLELRHRLVPLLVQTVREYARHESELLAEVTKQRAAVASATRVSERTSWRGLSPRRPGRPSHWRRSTRD